MNENIAIGFHAFTADGREEFGAIRGVSDDGSRLTVYVENAGDFTVPAEAVVSVGYQKVTFDCGRLSAELREAINHAHDAEIPNDDEVELPSVDDEEEDEGDIPTDDELDEAEKAERSEEDDESSST